jgi:phosphoglycolate phosphatase
MMRLAVFDCDGTLVDGQAEICAAMDEAFAAERLPAPDRHQIRRIVGLSLPQAMLRLTPDSDPERVASLVESYKQAFRTARADGRLQEPLFAGIRETLAGLHAGGWLLGIATGKSARGLSHCLATHGLGALFVTCQTADHHPSKPHPAMLEAALGEAMVDAAAAVMIGDTVYDIAMARAAGVRAIGVAWGYHTVQELHDAGADAVARDPAHLLELLP